MRFLTEAQLNRDYLNYHLADTPQAQEEWLWVESFGEADGEPGWSGRALVDDERTLIIYAAFKNTTRRAFIGGGGRYPLAEVHRLVTEISAATGKIDLAVLDERLQALPPN